MNIDQIKGCAEYLKKRIGNLTPEIGIILGSGLGSLADSISDAVTVPYSEMPEMPVSTALGHKGNFIVGTLGGKCVIAMQGRFHFYEGYSMDKVVAGVRVMKFVGIKTLFVSNAAGALNRDYKVGDLVILRDHINLMPNPLIGADEASLGNRFPDMTCAYDPLLRRKAREIADELKLPVHEGVYIGVTGPSYETPAEIRFFAKAGADLVGMSTIPEVIAARHCKLSVFGMSVVTNISNTDNVDGNLNDGDDVVRAADAAAGKMRELFTRLIERT